MMDNGTERSETLARMEASRAEIRRLLEPPAQEEAVPGEEAARPFPRSRTMRLLMSGRGVGTVGAVIGGLVLARPALAWRLLRMVPAGAVGRMLLVKAVAALRQRGA
jgi:hypothetical protein